MQQTNIETKTAQTILDDAIPVKKIPKFYEVLWREIWKDKLAFISLIIFLGIVLVSFIWAATIDEGYATRIEILQMNQAPSDRFPMGTDEGGRDMRNMLILGARNSLQIAFIVTLITLVFGSLIGLISGFYGGKVDNIIMRIVDTLSMLPTLMIIIILIFLSPGYNQWFFIGIMSLFGWIGSARLIRTRALQQSNLEYAHASKTLGTPNLIILFREVTPNLVSILSVNLVLSLASNIGLETGLTFLGFGLPPHVPSLGRLLTVAGQPTFIANRIWQWLPAAILVIVLVFAINFIGQAFQRAVDAKQRMAS
ncbi:MAG: ABC transporter permease [Defluviitaleaceae bacterium]|nr:ABC transporter permease [Defluviitaleaceae bacterium]